MVKNNTENKEVENNEELFVGETVIENTELAVWIAKAVFRDTNDFNKVYEVGDEVEYSELRDKLGLIELK